MIALLSSAVGRVLFGAIAVLGALRYGTGVWAWRETNRLEKPIYTVVRRLADGVEIRKYEPYLIAETTVPKEGFRESTGDGFRKCASYIFGNSKPRGAGWWKKEDDDGVGEKMAMTAPVRVSGQSTQVGEKMAMTSPVRASGGSGKTKVSFVIGSKYDLKSVPKPVDRAVSLREVPSHYLAARRFAGPPPKDSRVRKERERIEKALGEAGVQAKAASDGSDTMVYGYHDPFITPNFLRRNEVAIMVDSSSV
uniref:SOUL heme-binding protein n=1 Tax=Odontella aurita TaxID=265563 RepID=A0A7S4KD62_9STRA|mmetsp:Transcript_9217/g.27757  ORF Transcript_9217/g.27757 Transcript_9217/m.27757 type:complete len:251 (+) Transcript_9217:99-851(+)